MPAETPYKKQKKSLTRREFDKECERLKEVKMDEELNPVMRYIRAQLGSYPPSITLSSGNY